MDYIDTIQTYLLLAFNAAQWHILGMIILVTSVMTESVKRLIPSFSPKTRDKIIYAASLVLGIITTVAGYYVATKMQPLWFWLVTGALTGPVSNWLYRMTMPAIKRLIAWKYPELTAKRAK